MLHKMCVNRLTKTLHHSRRPRACLLCTDTKEAPNSDPPPPELKKRKKRAPFSPSAKHIKEIEEFFAQNPKIQRYRHLLPQLIVEKKFRKTPDLLYLISPKIAEEVADRLAERITDKSHVIAESNPGLGLISERLLKKGFTSLRLYEGNVDFQDHLLNEFQSRKDQVKLFKKEFFRLYQYANQDKYDQQGRVQNMLEHLSKKNWTDDPFMTVVGCLTRTSFLRHMIKSLVLQSALTSFGRVNLFLLTQKRHWDILNATTRTNRRPWHLLMKLFFDSELIDKYPRKFFLPWESSMNKEELTKEYDSNHIYLVRTIFKKDLPLDATDLPAFYCFMMHLYSWGSSSIIKTCEQWVPDCGENILLPKLELENYPEELETFTKFKDIKSSQIIPLFREIAAHPNFCTSPFRDMIEQELLKTDTIETDLHDSQIKKKIILT